MADDEKYTAHLVFAIVASALGSGFQHGYHAGVTNIPEDVLKNWLLFVGKFTSQSSLNLTWSVATSILNLGGTLGGMCSGLICLYLGPKKSLIFNNVLVVVACLLMGLSKQIETHYTFILGRFIIGINCGINAGICPMYLSEIAPTKLRGAVGSYYQLVITLSILFAQAAGLRQTLGTWNDWPFLFFLPLVLVAIQVPMMMYSTESPRYLIQKDKTEEAEKALKWLRQSDDTGTELSKMQEDDRNTKALPKITPKGLFEKTYLRKPLVISVVLMIAQQFSGINAVIFYSTDTFKNTAKLSNDDACYGTLGIGCVNVAMTVISVYLVDKAGRKTLLLIGFGGMAITQVLITIFCYFRNESSALAYSVIGMVVIYIILFAAGAGSIPWFLVSEIFNQAARPAAVSIAVPTNWIANFVVTMSFPSLQKEMGSFVFLIFVGLNALFFSFIWFFVPETKNKEIDEIVKGFE